MYLSNMWVPLVHLHLHNHILTLYKRKACLSPIPNPPSGQSEKTGVHAKTVNDPQYQVTHHFQVQVILWTGPRKGVGEHSHVGAREAPEGVEAQTGVLHQHRPLHLQCNEMQP